jgi:hypothetical protein
MTWSIERQQFHVYNIIDASTYVRATREHQMKPSLIIILASTLLAGSVFAQNAAPTSTVAPTAKGIPAAAAFHALCKDGTAFDGASKRGACSGHGGIDKKAAAGISADTPTKSAPMGGKPVKAAPAPMDQAAGGGDGKVWVNTSSKVYHCQGDKYYGKTKHGEYMIEADAKTKGFHVSQGKACTK